MKLNPESLYAATLTEAEIQRCRNKIEPAAYGTGLLVDANNVMYRMAFAVSKEVSTTAEMLAVFVDKVKCAAHEVGAEVVVCAIDHGVPLRRSMLGAKKKPDKTPEQEAVIELARGALHLLRDGLSAGAKYPYLNPFYMDGYEADDIVAAFAVSNLFAHAVIYSTDSDLYQVTNGSGVTQLSPSTGRFLVSEVPPFLVPGVKALAGDSSDSIAGLPGVGPKTALDILTGKKTLDLEKAQIAQVCNDVLLTALPFPGSFNALNNVKLVLLPPPQLESGNEEDEVLPF
jgi:5'-3' exonuclease